MPMAPAALSYWLTKIPSGMRCFRLAVPPPSSLRRLPPAISPRRTSRRFCFRTHSSIGTAIRTNVASWVSLGLFASGWADVAVLSHELTETFNDPFGGNLVPWWLEPNGNCQNNLETGDVIEGLPNAIKTIHLGGSAYHVQNEALLQ